MEKIGLAEAIEALRSELAAASAAAQRRGLKFRVEQATVELEVVTERAMDGSVGLKFWVVEANAGSATTRGRTHRVTVALTPLDDGAPLMTADDELPQ